MRYYLYISWSKVNLLFSQIPKRLRPRIAAEIGFDIGLFSARLSAEPPSPQEPTEMNRLLAVEKYILENEVLGSIERPDVWVRDTVYAKVVILQEGQDVVFFTGKTAFGTLFALGGSHKHLVSRQIPGSFAIGWSFLPDLLSALSRYDRLIERSSIAGESKDRVIANETRQNEHEWMELIQTIQRHAPGPEIRVDFLAKRLLSGIHPNTNERGLLGSPIYVSQLN